MRSRAPTRLSSTMSEIRTVRTGHDQQRAEENAADDGDRAATMSLLKYCFAVRKQLGIAVERRHGGQHPGDDRQHLAHEAADHGEQPETSITAISMTSRRVIGMLC